MEPEAMWQGAGSVEEAFAAIGDFARQLRSGLPVFVVWMLICMGAAGLFLHFTTPVYVAAVRVALQPYRIAPQGPEDVQRLLQIDLDGWQAETELRVLRSERLLRSVFNTMHLADVPDLQSGPRGLWPALARLVRRLNPAHQPVTKADLAFEAFASRVRVSRLELSYVMEITYTSADAARAAEVANVLATTYLRERIALSRGLSDVSGPYLKRQANAALNQSMVVSHALASRSVPNVYLPDADVRVLGSAIPPHDKAFPKAVPLLAVAMSLGFVTWLGAQMILFRYDSRIRNAAQLQRRLQPVGLMVVGLPAASRPNALLSLQPALQTSMPDGRGTLGLLTWQPVAATERIAQALNGLTRDLGQSPGGRAPGELRTDAEALGPQPVTVLPPLRDSLESAPILSTLDAVVLVIEARRTTFRMVRMLLQASEFAGACVVGLVLVEQARGRPLLRLGGP